MVCLGCIGIDFVSDRDRDRDRETETETETETEEEEDCIDVDIVINGIQWDGHKRQSVCKHQPKLGGNRVYCTISVVPAVLRSGFSVWS